MHDWRKDSGEFDPVLPLGKPGPNLSRDFIRFSTAIARQQHDDHPSELSLVKEYTRSK